MATKNGVAHGSSPTTTIAMTTMTMLEFYYNNKRL